MSVHQFRSLSLCKKSFVVCCKHYKQLASKMHQLAPELRTMLNLDVFEESFWKNSWDLSWDHDTALLNVEAKNTEKTNLDNRLTFHHAEEYGDICNLDIYRFKVLFDPQDKKRLLVVSSVNNSPYSVENCPTLERYDCFWHQYNWCYRKLPCAGICVALSRFITQNPYIDYILSFTRGIVRYPVEFPTPFAIVSSLPERIARIEHFLSWLHLIPTTRRMTRLTESETCDTSESSISSMGMQHLCSLPFLTSSLK